MIRSLIKIGASFSKFTKGAADNIFKWSEKLVTNANVIPIGGQMASFASIKKTKDNTMDSLTGSGFRAQQVQDQTEKLRT